MTALLLPMWAGWISLTVWLAGYTAGVWWVAHHIERRRFDRLLDVARLLRQGMDTADNLHGVRAGQPDLSGPIWGTSDPAAAAAAAHVGLVYDISALVELEADEDRRRAHKYRAAWLSARRRARSRVRVIEEAPNSGYWGDGGVWVDTPTNTPYADSIRVRLTYGQAFCKCGWTFTESESDPDAHRAYERHQRERHLMP